MQKCSNRGQAHAFHSAQHQRRMVHRAGTAKDERGWFARVYCEAAFAERKLETHFPQHSLSFSREKGTLRGLHYQNEPHSETKLVTCLQGIVWDVLVDLRPHSPTYRRWAGVELSAENGVQLYIPEGCATVSRR